MKPATAVAARVRRTRRAARTAAWIAAWMVTCGMTLPAWALPSFNEVKAAHRPSDLTLLDRHGMPIQTRRLDHSVRRLPWVGLPDLSPALLQAIVLSEDQRFWQHGGVDWPAIARSAWGNAINQHTRGASTLTMQLAGLIDDGLARPAGGRSLGQKIGQAVTATQLEARWTKSQIIEAYLNAVPFRGELVGITALSQTLFGKHPSGLDAQEAAITAALLRAPNAAPERVAERACGVLKRQRLACDGVASLASAALARRGGKALGEQLAPHFARQVMQARGPAQQTSTLDAGLQRVALATLRQQLAELAGGNVEDGAIVVLDNASGEVRAWVGSSGVFSDAPEVDAVLARRQPGSTLKPFIYGLAFEQRLITPATLLDDAPVQINTGAGLYLPQNYDRDFRGWVSARSALGGSLNVPAVRVAAMLGPDAVVQRLNDLGLALPQPGGFYGPALALGAADVTLLALTNAYRALANGGLWSPVALLPVSAKPAAHRVAQAGAVALVSDILADNSARVATFGLDSALATRGFAAVKTGTSKDLRDNWCLGYTDRYTVGVWVGNASGTPMHGVSGTSGAAPVWRALVQHLHAGAPSRAAKVPAGVVALAVRFDGGREPPRTELFLAGTEQALQRAGLQASTGARGPQRFGISSPRDGSIFALDPDIPPKAQRISFEGEAGTWLLDGRRIGESVGQSPGAGRSGGHAGPGKVFTWAPWPGAHQLSLLARDGHLLQTVRFEVRGATLRQTAKPAGR